MILTDLVDGDDVRMVERRGGLGLEHEAPETLFIAHERGREDLQGDVPLESLIPRPVDLPHATGPERSEDAVAGDPIVRLESVSRGLVSSREGDQRGRFKVTDIAIDPLIGSVLSFRDYTLHVLRNNRFRVVRLPPPPPFEL